MSELMDLRAQMERLGVSAHVHEHAGGVGAFEGVQLLARQEDDVAGTHQIVADVFVIPLVRQCWAARRVLDQRVEHFPQRGQPLGRHVIVQVLEQRALIVAAMINHRLLSPCSANRFPKT